MKHAIIIIAHKNFNHLVHLIEYFEKDCYLFVHIDKKSDFTKHEINQITAIPHVVKVYKKYAVHWGGFSMLKCEMFLLKESLHLCNAEYFHLLSGQDYPVKPLSKFLIFFNINKGKEFMQMVHLPHPGWDKNTFIRFQYYYPHDFCNVTAQNLEKVSKIIGCQKKLGIKRRIPDIYDHIYGSSQWFSITRKAVSIILKKSMKHFLLWNKMRFTFAPEESYLSTILGNEYQQKENIIPNNLRYIRWKYENGNCPANLDIEHLFMLMNKEFLFARKFDSNSKKLIEIIDQYLIKEEKSFHNIVGKWDYNGFQQYPYNHKLAFQIASIGKYIKCMSAVDIGCGAGLYVSGLRRMGIPIIGFDANRYTSILSKMILPLNDQPCEVIDFSDEIDIETPYDLSICINTIEYVAPSKVEQFLKNIVRVTGKCLIANFTTDTLDNKRIMSFFTEEKFIENTYMSALLNKPIIQDSNFKSKIFCLLKV